MVNKLPIELVPNSDPPRFRWSRVVDGTYVEDVGGVAPHLECALVDLIAVARRLQSENISLKKRLEALTKQEATSAAQAPTVDPKPRPAAPQKPQKPSKRTP